MALALALALAMALAMALALDMALANSKNLQMKTRNTRHLAGVNAAARRWATQHRGSSFTRR